MNNFSLSTHLDSTDGEPAKILPSILSVPIKFHHWNHQEKVSILQETYRDYSNAFASIPINFRLQYMTIAVKLGAIGVAASENVLFTHECEFMSWTQHSFQQVQILLREKQLLSIKITTGTLKTALAMACSSASRCL